MDKSQTSVSEYSEDYPLGGSVEPYDIWREKQLIDQYCFFVKSLENKTSTSLGRQMS